MTILKNREEKEQIYWERTNIFSEDGDALLIHILYFTTFLLIRYDADTLQ